MSMMSMPFKRMVKASLTSCRLSFRKFSGPSGNHQRKTSKKGPLDPSFVLRNADLGHCLIIGALGSVGNSLTKLLLTNPSCFHSVTCIDIKSQPSNLLHPTLVESLNINKSNTTNNKKRINYIQCDIGNTKTLEKLFVKHNFDTVFHTASLRDLRSIVDDRRMYKINVDATQSIINLCIEYEVSNLVYTSSTNAIYDGSKPLAERNVFDGNEEDFDYPNLFETKYDETKSIAEQSVLKYNNYNNILRTCAMRLPLVFGELDSIRTKTILDTMGLIVDYKTFYVQILGRNKLSMVYNENAAYAHILAVYKMQNEDLNKINRKDNTFNNNNNIKNKAIQEQMVKTLQELKKIKPNAKKKDNKTREREREKEKGKQTEKSKRVETEKNDSDTIETVSGNAFVITDFDTTTHEFECETFEEYLGLKPMKIDFGTLRMIAGINDAFAYVKYRLTNKLPESGTVSRKALDQSSHDYCWSGKKAEYTLGYQPLVDKKESIKTTAMYYKKVINNKDQIVQYRNGK